MFGVRADVLARLTRWPRWIAAGLCLLLAAVSAFVPAHATGAAARPSPRAENPLARGLRGSEVAVPVTVASGAGIVRVGDRIGLIASDTAVAPVAAAESPPDLIADHLPVLSISASSAGFSTDATVVVVAADRPTAVQIASAEGSGVLAVLDKSP